MGQLREHGMAMKWFVVHTYSGQEKRAKDNLQAEIKKHHLEPAFGEVLIPQENVLEVVKGHKKHTMRKFYPGYLFVQMELNERTFGIVKNTPKITGFLGGTNPSPVRESEIAAINSAMAEGQVKAKPRITFEEGDSVRVTEGPFANFSGTVEDVKPEKQKVRVLVSIFGRATPVELDFTQVEKA
jgi:transcriptional antiterminator NusG